RTMRIPSPIFLWRYACFDLEMLYQKCGERV
ncbi:MAG: hypothetical protein ACI9HK_004475, partial [Pirellulaceae bacterium]